MIDLRGIHLSAPDGEPVLVGVDLSLARGRTLVVLGASGSGKSQLLRVLAGTLPPAAGTLDLDGAAVWPGEGCLGRRKLRMAMGFGEGGLLANQTIRANVALPLRFAALQKGSEIEARVDKALLDFHLDRIAHLRPHAVGARDRRMANLARAWALDPDLILLDEPLAELDRADQARALYTFAEWAWDPGRTVVVATEDPGPFEAYATDRAVLHEGRLRMVARFGAGEDGE